ncbi:unnamed protein product [Meloidogyne enterolobii]|uniref:Uncharacterized protein n=1 Tax=Meloidogyne enterolobii TaxID=390850 RepID=A0ACB1AB67_MELEN
MTFVRIFYQFIDAVILQCFNDGLTAIQAEKKIIETEGINIKLSIIEHRFKESDDLILQCFNDGLTGIDVEKKIKETEGINILLSTIQRRHDEWEKYTNSLANLLNSKEGSSSANQGNQKNFTKYIFYYKEN